MNTTDLQSLVAALEATSQVMKRSLEQAETSLKMVPPGNWAPAGMLEQVRSDTVSAVRDQLAHNTALLERLNPPRLAESLGRLNALAVVASERLLERGLDIPPLELADVTRWAHHPHSVRELLRHAPRVGDPSYCAGCHVADGMPHQPRCAVVLAWNALGDPRGTGEHPAGASAGEGRNAEAVIDEVFERSEVARRRLLASGIAHPRIAIEVLHEQVSTRVLRVDGRPVWQATARIEAPGAGVEERWLIMPP